MASVSSLPHRTFSCPLHSWRRKAVGFQLAHRDSFWCKEQPEIRLESRLSSRCSLHTSLPVVMRDSLREGGFTMITIHECLRSTLGYELTCLHCGSSQEAEGDGCWCPSSFLQVPCPWNGATHTKVGLPSLEWWWA